MSITEVPLVATYRQVAQKAIHSDANQILEQVRSLRTQSDEEDVSHHSAIDTTFRELFVELVASLDIENDDYAPVWSLLDSVNLLCDKDLCEPGLGFWLIEDLLDSQTISGCREAFKYLESRRERMTKINFKAKHLTILRCCNELLRRLSRAEDTVFCGRVFIYLFQSFPLGDKSSVNLRGEFHTENITIYDEIAQPSTTGDGAMEIDGHVKTEATHAGTQSVDGPQEKTNLDQLYPTFWSMQSLFSSPTRLFEDDTMQQFKDAIKQTVTCFANVAQSSASAAVQDPDKRGVKRKRGDASGERAELNASTFNPKYLTNRDLFDLEVHDIEFRRHVLVQSLILLDFLLSLSAQQKTKFSSLAGTKSIMTALYDKYTLSEDNRSWALETRKTIERYLEEGNGTEGRYYLRMVNMVLSRDKNWTFWKAEACPSISKDPVEAAAEKGSQDALQKISSDANRPTRRQDAAHQLQFLSQTESLEALKGAPSIPSLEEYYNGIQNDELDLDFADAEEKKKIEELMAGKLWRALRSARGKRFALCEEIKDGENLGALIGKKKQEEPEAEEEPEKESEQEQDQEQKQETEPEAEAPEQQEAVKQEQPDASEALQDVDSMQQQA